MELNRIAAAADLVFILLDRPDETHDRMISEHIMRTHALASSGADAGGRTAGTGGSQGKSNPGSSSSSQAARREGVDQSTLSQRLRRVVEQYEEHPMGSQMPPQSQSQHDAGESTSNMWYMIVRHYSTLL